MGYSKPIQINPDGKVRVEIERMAQVEGRKNGPMALEMIKRYLRGEKRVVKK